MSDADRRRIHACVSGRVQGVYYRASTREMAASLGLAGWVRNLPDGRVELEAEGPERDMGMLLAWLREGPPSARVDDVAVTPLDPTCASGDFAVRH